MYGRWQKNSYARGPRLAHELNSSINITPFVDVVLVLLIVFMISAPLMVNGVQLDLPKSSAQDLPATISPITISLDISGNYYISDKRLANLDDLLMQINKIVKFDNKNKQTIFVKADKSISYSKILELLSRLQKVGFTKISLIGLAED